MSSRFVSCGAIDAATGNAVVPAAGASAAAAPGSGMSELAKPAASAGSAVAAGPQANTAEAPDAESTGRQAEWAAVERELEADRQRRAEARRAAGTGAAAEKSLYEVLQANKAAKQAAFEEAHKLKHQFRPLDEDEVNFLEGVEAKARADAERLRAETEAGLDAFRAAQQKGGASAEESNADGSSAEPIVGDGIGHGNVVGDDVDWQAATGRKRKRTDRVTAFPNLKRKGRHNGGPDKGDETAHTTDMDRDAKQPAKEAPAAVPAAAAVPKAKPKAGLVDYGSDDDSDD